MIEIEMIRQGQELTQDQKDNLAKCLPLIKSQVKVAEDYLKGQLQDGQEIKGAKLMNGRKTRKIISAKEAYLDLKDSIDFEWPSVLEVNLTALEKAWCGDVTPRSNAGKEKLISLHEKLGVNLNISIGSPWMKLG